jgi:translation initiation factor IF-1
MNQFAQSNKTFLSQKLQNTMQIFVQMSGGCITLDVHPSDTIRFIKGRIQDLKSVAAEQQVLIHAGKCLIDDRSLMDYGCISGGATVHLVVRCRGGAKAMINAKIHAVKQQLGVNERALALARPGESFYGRVLRALGDRRFMVENVATGRQVQCRLGGSVGYKDRSQQNIKAEEWVLVSVRAYESDNEHHDRKGEILLRYSAKQVGQLSRAGELPERSRAASSSSVVFVQAEDAEGGSDVKQRREFDLPVTPESHDSDEEGEQSDEEDILALVFARAARAADACDALPPPSSGKKPQRSSSKGLDCAAKQVDVDFHHAVGYLPEGQAAATVEPVQRVPRPRCAPLAPVAAPAHPHVTIPARVRFWDAVKGMGYATPEDKSRTRGGVDVKLTAECVKGLKRQLQRDDLVEVTINPDHDRPFVMPGGLRRM